MKFGAGTGDWPSGFLQFQCPSTKLSLAEWHRTDLIPLGPLFPLPSMKWREYCFFLLVQHRWTRRVVIVVVLGDVCETAGIHCLRGSEGGRGGEGQKEQYLVSTHPSQLLSPPPPLPCFWFGESFIPPIMLCIGADWERVYGLTSCFFACFLN